MVGTRMTILWPELSKKSSRDLMITLLNLVVGFGQTSDWIKKYIIFFGAINVGTIIHHASTAF
jgi:hypothetical protein